MKKVIGALDSRGRWVEDGRLKYHGDDVPVQRVIDCRTFLRNVRVLSEYLRADRQTNAEFGMRNDIIADMLASFVP